MSGRTGRGWLAWVLAGLMGCGGMPPEVEEAPGEVRSAALDTWHSGDKRWVLTPEGPGEDIATSVAVDRDDNVVTVGMFGPYIEQPPLRLEASAPYTLFAMKHDREGRLLWAQAFEGATTREDLIPLVAVNRERDIFIAGTSFTPVDFGGGTIATGRFLLKLDKRGRFVWSKALGGTGGLELEELLTDREGRIILVGSFFGTLDVGDGPISSPIPLDTSGFIAVFAPDGRALWTHVDTERSRYFGLAVDSDDNLYVGGTRAADNRPILKKFSPRGALRWTRGPVELSSGGFQDVAVHGNRVVVAGTFSAPFSLTFAGRPVEAGTFPVTAGLVLAYTADGEERWARVLGRQARGAGTDARGSLRIAGYYAAGQDLGEGPEPGVPGGFAGNLFTVRLDRIDGDVREVETFPGVETSLRDFAVGRHGTSALVGAFYGPLDFGSGPVTPTPEGDLFILHLGK